ncbi:MAG TPA: hypothetical protein VLK22_00900 [Candidatus Udaeobacter sp.]|nr:hypothetical protein [Candidatus Udaeobacter sp.]
MKFEDYLSRVVQKIGPKTAFDLGRDARIKALQNLLIKKVGATLEEIEAEEEKEFEELAKNIEKMPPLPNK